MSEELNQNQNEVFQQKSQQYSGDVPVEVVSLPSKGLIYPLGSPLCNEAELEIKCMSAKEEDILSSRALLKSGQMMTKLVESCLLNKTINAEEMLPGDQNALMIAIRITGYGPHYQVDMKCPECNEETEYDFVLQNLKVKSLGASPVSPNVNLFEYVLPYSQQKVQFKLLTIKDERLMSQEMEKAKKATKSQIDNLVTTKLRYSIVAVNGDSNPQTINNLINSMRASDSRSLRNYMTSITPDVEMKQDFDCPACSAVTEVEIPLGISFFWPDL